MRALRSLRCAAVLFLAGGCSSMRSTLVLSKPPPHVAVKGYAVDLEYGKESVAVAGDAPAGGIDAPLFLQGGDFVLPGVDSIFFPGVPFTPRPVISACPEPGPDVGAERAITTDVKVQPDVGVYRFKQTGTLKLGPITSRLDGLVSRTVRNLRTNPLGGFDYDIQLSQSFITQYQTLRVIPASSTSTGQPAAGIQLVSLKLHTSSGDIDFNPLAPVTIFPLPASENTAVTGAGVDAKGTTMAVQGTITHKDRIEGCNEVVDGWTADTTWTFVRGSAQPVVWTYSYTIATQHGGLMVGDHLQSTDTVGGIPLILDITSAIGGVHPKAEAQ